MRAFRAHPRKQNGDSKDQKDSGADFKAQGSQRLKSERWRAAFDRDGKLNGMTKMLKCIIAGGVDHSIRAEVWEFLLGCYDANSSLELREQIRQDRRKRYKDLIEQCRMMHVSIGTGTLAYTVGNKVMDARIAPKENGRSKPAKVLVDSSLLDESASISPCSNVQPSVPSPMGFSFTSMPSPFQDNETSFYSDSSDPEGEFHEAERHRSPLRSLIAVDCDTSPTRYCPGRVGPNSPNVLHAKFFQQSGTRNKSCWVDSQKNLGKLKSKVAEIGTHRVAPREPRTAGTPSPNPLLLQINEERMAEWLWTLHKIVIDVVRTDRHLKFYDETKNMARMSDILAVYAWIDPATGYCQGMSDLLSPFVVLFEDDADAFWCFESLLRRMRQNFHMDGPIGVMQQLEALPRIMELTDLRIFRHMILIGAENFLFAFRMLLLQFRRELPFPEALCLWEMMWAADFDKPTFECEMLEPLQLKAPSVSLQQRLREEDSVEYVSSRLSPYTLSPCPSPQPETSFSHSIRTKSPLCGLGPRSWQQKHDQQKTRTSSHRAGDSEISVFIVAAILVINRSKFLKEVQTLDDAIKMFNDIHLKINVRSCMRTALKIRVTYQQQLAKRSRVESL